MMEDCGMKQDMVKLLSELTLRPSKGDEDDCTGTHQEIPSSSLPIYLDVLLGMLDPNLLQSFPPASMTQDVMYMLPQFEVKPPEIEAHSGVPLPMPGGRQECVPVIASSSSVEINPAMPAIPLEDASMEGEYFDDRVWNFFAPPLLTSPEDSAIVSSNTISSQVENEVAEGNQIHTSIYSSPDFIEFLSKEIANPKTYQSLMDSDAFEFAQKSSLFKGFNQQIDNLTEQCSSLFISDPGSECSSSHHVNSAKECMETGPTENIAVLSFAGRACSEDCFNVKSGVKDWSTSNLTMSNVHVDHSIPAMSEVANSFSCLAESYISNEKVMQTPESQTVISKQSCGSSGVGQKSMTHANLTHFDENLCSVSKCTTFSRSNEYLNLLSMNYSSEVPSAYEQSLAKLKPDNHLELYLSTQIMERPTSSDQCPKKCKFRGDFKQHSLIPSGVKLLSCDQCSEQFKTKEYLKGHSQHTHSNEKPFSCEHCSARFKTKGYLKQHSRHAHSNKRPFSCEQCSSRFKSKGEHKKHSIRIHSNERLFSCEHCSLQFKSKGELKQHLIHIHSNERPLSCEHCSAQFKSKKYLKQHSRHAHSNQRPFSCEQCSSRFKSKGELQQHLKRVHSNERPFSCEQCSLQFKSKGEIKDHSRRAHSNERPFSCEQCFLQFKSKCDLKQHSKYRHSNERPFSCEHCSAQFKTKGHLKIHSNVHSNERSFSCKQCQSQFKSRRSLLRHARCHYAESAVEVPIYFNYENMEKFLDVC